MSTDIMVYNEYDGLPLWSGACTINILLPIRGDCLSMMHAVDRSALRKKKIKKIRNARLIETARSCFVGSGYQQYISDNGLFKQ